MRPLLPLSIALALAPTALAQTTWYVDGANTPPGSGTQADPYSGIQLAIAAPATLPGDRIVVAPGLYLENVAFGAKRLVLESSAGPLATEIRAAGPGHVVALSAALPLAEEHRFEGFTVSGGFGPADAGIFVPVNCNATVRRTIVRGCAGYGVLNDYDLVLQTSTLSGNGVGLRNGGLGVLWDTSHLIVFGNFTEIDIVPYFGPPIEDSILPTPCSNCGAGTFYADPRFWGEGAPDYRLRPGSPAILPGTDMGALEHDPTYAPPPHNLCLTAPNSVGPGAIISASGSASIAAAEFTLHVTGAVPLKFGIFYYGPVSALIPFGDGYRCVGTGGLGFFRTGNLLTSDTGSASRTIDFGAPPAGAGPGTLAPGTSWTFQFLYRDPAGPLGTGFNLSDGLRAHFIP